MAAGFIFTQPLTKADREILTDEALAFLAELVDRFSGRRAELLAARKVWQARIDAGGLPGFRRNRLRPRGRLEGRRPAGRPA